MEQPASPQTPGPSVDTGVHSANSVGPSALAPGRVSWFWLAAGARRGRSWKSHVPAPEEAIWAASEALGAPVGAWFFRSGPVREDLMKTYARLGLAFDRGDGHYLYTAAGRRYPIRPRLCK